MGESMPDAVLFDLDGLLIDTETCDFVAWEELYAHHGQTLTLDEYCHNAGLYGCWDRLYDDLAMVAAVNAADLHAWRAPRFEALVRKEMAPRPSLAALLDRLDRHGTAMGVASSSDRDWVARLLNGMEIRERFRTVVTGDDVRKRKPAPDIYLLATAQVGAAPERTVALEDSAHGIAAARSAGLRVIAVPNRVTARQDLSHAHLRVGGLEEVTMELLESLLARP